jgi:hypothetical protein
MFSLLRGLLKGLEMIWKWHIYENSYIYIYIYDNSKLHHPIRS